MQPPEPVTGPAQQPAGGAEGSPPIIPAQPGGGGMRPPGAGGGRARRRGLRLGLAIGAGVLALLCLGGVGVFISLYDEATEIKRTAPDAVVDSFLRAYLVNRDQQEEALYTCKAGADFAALAALREELVMREANFDVKVVVSWSSLAVIETDSRTGSVTTDLTIAGTSQGETQSRRTEPWRFGVVDDDGWRVCTATKDV